MQVMPFAVVNRSVQLPSLDVKTSSTVLPVDDTPIAFGFSWYLPLSILVILTRSPQTRIAAELSLTIMAGTNMAAPRAILAAIFFDDVDISTSNLGSRPSSREVYSAPASAVSNRFTQ